MGCVVCASTTTLVFLYSCTLASKRIRNRDSGTGNRVFGSAYNDDTMV